MARYTQVLVFSLSSTELLVVHMQNVDGTNSYEMNLPDFLGYVTFVDSSNISFSASVSNLFTLYPDIAYISYNNPDSFSFGFSGVVVSDGYRIFRNSIEWDAFDAGTLLTTDFSNPTPPQNVSVDLTPLLNKMDEILTNQQSQSQNMNNISSELLGITASLSDFSQTLDTFQTSLDSLSQSVSFLPNASFVTDLHNDLAVKLNLVHGLNNDIFGKLGTFDLSELNNLHEDIVTLGNQLSGVTVPLQSLNGNGCEFIDGAKVTVLGREAVIYSVSRSYMGMTADNAYTAVYDLESTNGAKCTAPEALLTLYVAPVVTP